MNRNKGWFSSDLLLLIVALAVASCTGSDILVNLNTTPIPSPTPSTTTTPTVTYSLSLSAGTGGTVTASPTGPTYNAGTVVTLTASPNSGKKVSAWTGTTDDTSLAVQNHVTMSADKSVNVNFTDVTLATYTLTLNAGAHGTVVASPNQSTFTDGTVVTLTATPDPTYSVSAWSGTDNNASTSNSNQVTMSSDKIVGVSFAIPAPHVSISGMAFSPSSLTVSVGTTVQWTNNDAFSHTATSTTPAGEFDTGVLTNGQSASHTFNSAGTYHYDCTIHGASMTGTITVQ